MNTQPTTPKWQARWHRKTVLRSAAVALVALLVSAACSSGVSVSVDSTQPAETVEETADVHVTLTIDPSIVAADLSLPGLTEGEVRPVAGTADEDGEVAKFIENELWVTTDDETVLASYIERFNGTVIAQIDADEVGIDGVVSQYLLRVELPETAGEGELNADLSRLGVIGSGDFSISSESGRSLILAAAAASSLEAPVGINWVGESDSLDDRILNEAPVGSAGSGHPGVSYDPNVFNWPAFDGGPNRQLDIGVAEAWRALDASGKNGPVTLAILDQGFEPNQDWPDGLISSSVIPFTDALGSPAGSSCGSDACRWHGTNTVSAAMALSGNGYGAAGPAGPVARPMVVYTSPDFFFANMAVLRARASGAQIASMSFGTVVPWYVAWSVLPFENTTKALASNGMLMFASAGNSGVSVDKLKCFVRCWEKAWVTPCENDGVICVGGTQYQTDRRSQGSNYGPEDVNIYAPYSLWVGPDPLHTQNEARLVDGTSFSAPFVAGVAALVWAANPSLRGAEVKQILYDTASPSADPDVNRFVNAQEAVKVALGNIAPEVTLLSPSDGRVVELHQPVRLQVNVRDFEDGGPSCCVVVWQDSNGNALGTGVDVEVVFDTPGEVQLSATATDTTGLSTSVTTTIQVRNTAPRMTIVNPRQGTEVFQGVPFDVQGTSFDVNVGGPLDCGFLVWTTDVNSDLTVFGCETSLTLMTLGPRQLTLTGQDFDGAFGTTTIDIVVVEAPENLPPAVTIAEPIVGASLANQLTTLQGSAVDPEGDTDLTYEWVLTWPYDLETGTGEGTEVIGNSAEFVWDPADQLEPFQSGDDASMVLLLELKVTDSAGNVGVDSVQLSLIQIG